MSALKHFYKTLAKPNSSLNKSEHSRTTNNFSNLNSFYRTLLTSGEGVTTRSQNAERHISMPQVSEPTFSSNTEAATVDQLTHFPPNTDALLSQLIFESDGLELFIEKGVSQRDTAFRLEDHLYFIKFRPKEDVSDFPLLIQILNLLFEGLNHIVTELLTLYNPNERNLCYLTIYQEPMINGLNAEPFILQTDSKEMVDRILQILNQYLTSNQTLEINNTFKVYVQILSVGHSKLKFISGPPRKNYRKKHYGCSDNLKPYKMKWAIDVPFGFTSTKHPTLQRIFFNKCLITSIIIGHYQNVYYKTNKKDKTFLYLQSIKSSYEHKKIHGFKLLADLMTNVIKDLNITTQTSPYEIDSTCKCISSYYKCQIFVFTSIVNSNKLTYMYPTEYDDTLEPIYLLETSPNHVIVITNINAYFKANGRFCFGCKKSFKVTKYRHKCTIMKTQCFACRRLFMSNSTYINDLCKHNFCDRDITKSPSSICHICNITIYSNHCMREHKKLCNGKGIFGWKCLVCKKFTYRSGTLNSRTLSQIHMCNIVHCKFCHKSISNKLTHCCELRKESYPTLTPCIAYLGLELYDSSYANCWDCFETKQKIKCTENLTWKEINQCNLKCDIHKNLPTDEKNHEVLLIIVYKQMQPKGFNRVVFSKGSDSINVEYSNSDSELDLSNLPFKSQTKDFLFHYEKLHTHNYHTLELLDRFLLEITKPSWNNVTFICQDSDSLVFNLILKGFLKHGFCPNVVQTGRIILYMEVKPFKLRFVRSNNYLPGTEYDLKEQFKLKIDNYFFPETIPPNVLKCFNCIPKFESFLKISDSEDLISKKNCFIAIFWKILKLGLMTKSLFVFVMKNCLL
jgi:hypothetical protein